MAFKITVIKITCQLQTATKKSSAQSKLVSDLECVVEDLPFRCKRSSAGGENRRHFDVVVVVAVSDCVPVFRSVPRSSLADVYDADDEKQDERNTQQDDDCNDHDYTDLLSAVLNTAAVEWSGASHVHLHIGQRITVT